MPKSKYVLGAHFYGHDTGAALMKDGKLVCAVEEERFVREKSTWRYPHNAINYCLKKAKISLKDVTVVGDSMIPSLEFKRLTNGRVIPKTISEIGTLMWVMGIHFKRRFTRLKLRFQGVKKFRYIKHHHAHAASAFFCSPFKRAAILVIDGCGELNTVSFYKGYNNKMKLLKEIPFPHSIGRLYNVVSNYLGFHGSAPEGKIMGLAAYGDPDKFYKAFQKVVTLEKNGGFKLDLSFFNLYMGNNILTKKFYRLFGPRRKAESKLTQRHYNIAAALQKITEEAGIHFANHLYERTKEPNLCLAGGVVMNSVMNGRILKETKFKDFFIQAAASDCGTPLGTALYLSHQVLNLPRRFRMDHAYLGPRYSEKQMLRAIKRKKLEFTYHKDITKVAAKLIADGQIVGWFQGALELGPRALGHRSIIVDPRRNELKDILNSRVKHREGFRPFAPTIMEEHIGKYFEGKFPSPFMILVYKIKKKMLKKIPAVAHIDDTGRIQSVSKKQCPIYWSLINEFRKLTGVPVVLNTSFNIRGEPIINSPRDAIRCFLATDFDYLALGNFLIKKDKSIGIDKEYIKRIAKKE